METSYESEKRLKIPVIVIVICVIDLTFSESKKRFQKKARSKEFPFCS